MSDLTMKIRMVNSVLAATPSHFRGDNIEYNYLNNNLYKTGYTPPMMSGINRFVFTYYNKSAFSTTSILSDIRYVGVEFTMGSGNEAVSLKTKVKIRNLN